VAHITIAFINRSNLHKSTKNTEFQENEVRKVNEDETGEFIGIINYSIMALIQLELGVAHQPDLDVEKSN
jgi:hypothetical protein